MSRHNFKKKFGQNFLTQKKFAVKLVDYANVGPEDVVVEIGPGDGMVTKILLERAAKVIAIEVDYDVIPRLLLNVGNDPRLEVINKDVLEVDFKEIHDEFSPERPLKIVGSLPYNISKVIIKNILETNSKYNQRIIDITSFIIQNEVALDYAAKPPRSSFLAQYASLYADLKKKESIPAHQFVPRPKVDGAILQMTLLDSSEHIDKTVSIIKNGFIKPRRTVSNNLEQIAEQRGKNISEILKSVGVEENARAAEVTNDQWKQITEMIMDDRL